MGKIQFNKQFAGKTIGQEATKECLRRENETTELAEKVSSGAGEEPTNQNESNFEEGEKAPKILNEDVVRRGRFERHFKRSDGSYQAIISPYAVNYFDEEKKEYLPIDNAFEVAEKASEDGFEGYCNRGGAAKIKLAKCVSSDKLLTVQKGESILEWSLIGQKHGHGYCKHAESKGENTAMRERSHTGEVIYRDCFDGADLQYLLTESYLKDNIIVKAKSSEYEYDFRLKAKGLMLELSDDGKSIEFYIENFHDDGTREKEVKFAIPAPYMTDAAGARSEEVTYELEQDESGGGYLFSIKADAAWINAEERVLPVVIDPMIEFVMGRLKPTCKEIVSNGADSVRHSSPNALYVGNCLPIDGPYVARSLFFIQMPKSLRGKRIKSAVLKFRQLNAITHNKSESINYFETHKITGKIKGKNGQLADWYDYSAYDQLNWNNQPEFSKEIYARNAYRYSDQDHSVSNIQSIEIDLTKMVREWVENESENKGFLLKSAVENQSHENWMEIQSLAKTAEEDRYGWGGVGLCVTYGEDATVSDKPQRNDAGRAERSG